MYRIKIRVLFKNGIEKEFNTESNKTNLDNFITFVTSKLYVDDKYQSLQIGAVKIDVSETVYLEILEMEEIKEGGDK